MTLGDHSSTLAWKIPWMEEPGGLQSMGSLRVGHDWIPCLFTWNCHNIGYAAAAKLLQSCPTLSDPMDCSPPGSSIHGIFQARVLEWGATAFSEHWLYINTKDKIESLEKQTKMLHSQLRGLWPLLLGSVGEGAGAPSHGNGLGVCPPAFSFWAIGVTVGHEIHLAQPQTAPRVLLDYPSPTFRNNIPKKALL